MRKILILLLCATMYQTTSAQIQRDTRGYTVTITESDYNRKGPNVGYLLECNAGGGVSLSSFDRTFIGYVEIVNSVIFHNKFSAGIGIVANYTQSLLPIFLDLKGYLPLNKRDGRFGYLALDIGTTKVISKTPKVSGGVYFAIGPGYKSRLLDIGLRYQYNKFSSSTIVLQVGVSLNTSNLPRLKPGTYRYNYHDRHHHNHGMQYNSHNHHH